MIVIYRELPLTCHVNKKNVRREGKERGKKQNIPRGMSYVSKALVL
jgi:hypothetical protein